MSEFQLRAGGRADVPALAELLLRPRVLHSALFLMPLTPEEDAVRRVEEIQERARTGAHVVAVADGAVIGGIFIYRDKGFHAHAGTIAIGVHDQWHGRGVGSALMVEAIRHADDWLDLGRLVLYVAHDNEPAIRLYVKHGFVAEGRLRAHVFRAGRYEDVLVMGRLSPSLRARLGE